MPFSLPSNLLGPFGAPSPPHLPFSSPSSLSVSFHALETPWLGCLCIQMPSVWLSGVLTSIGVPFGVPQTFWCAPDLSVCLLVHLRISGCFWGTPKPPRDIQKAPGASMCCSRTGQVAKCFFGSLVLYFYFPLRQGCCAEKAQPTNHRDLG